MSDTGKKRKQPLIRKGYDTPRRKQKLTRNKSVKPKLNKTEKLNKNLLTSLRSHIFLNKKLSKILELFADNFIKTKLNEFKDLNAIKNIWNIPLYSQIKTINSIIPDNSLLEDYSLINNETKSKLIKEFFILDSIRKNDIHSNKYSELEDMVKTYFEKSLHDSSGSTIEDTVLYSSKKKHITASFSNLNIKYINKHTKKEYIKDIDFKQFDLFNVNKNKQKKKTDNIKILVAEDNVINQKLIFKTLNNISLEFDIVIEVDIASNGLEAFEMRKKNDYDLIFMDINMPIMTGDDSAIEIINWEEENNIPHIPIIAITANALRNDEERFLSIGMDGYLSKPLNQKDIQKLFDRLLGTQITNTLELSSNVEELIMNPSGLILVTGSIGSGKSTKLNSIINTINKQQQKHIIMIEETNMNAFIDEKCIITQINVNQNNLSTSQIIKSALRQDPDIIVVDEIRDRDTVDILLNASQTGHLVIGTLNLQKEEESIERIINMYPSSKQSKVREALSSTLKGVVPSYLN